MIRKQIIIIIFLILFISSLSAIENLGQVGSCFMNGGYCFENIIIDNIVYVCCEYGLLIIDVSVAGLPSILSTYETPKLCRSICFMDNYAILACGSTGVIILDVSDLYHPIYISTCELYYPYFEAIEMDIRDSTLFVTGGGYSQGFHIIDISNVYSPEILYFDNSHSSDFVVVNNYLYRQYSSSFYVIDISDLFNPVQVDSLNWGGYSQVEADGDKLYLANSSIIKTVDISTPENPEIIGEFTDFNSSISDLKIEDDKIFTIGDNLTIVGISDPANPVFLQEFAYKGRYLSKHNDQLSVSIAQYSGIGIIDLDNMENIHLAGEFRMGSPSRFCVKEDHAFMTSCFRGLTIIDISSPHHPQIVSDLYMNGNAQNVIIDNDMAYVAIADSGIKVIDIEEPENPFLISEIIQYCGKAIDIYNGFLYLGGETTNVKIYDISDPYNPIYVNQFRVNDYSYDLVVHEDYLYVAGYWGGLQIFDLSDPTGPEEVGYYPLDLALAVEAGDNFAFIGNFNYFLESLKIFDTSQIDSPELQYTYSYGTINDMDFFNNTLYTAGSSIHSYDLSSIYPVHTEISDIYGRGICASENYLFLTGNHHFYVFGDTTVVSEENTLINQPQNKNNLSNYPNPFNPENIISFELDSKSYVKLSIYNIKGQKITTLVDNELLPGNHAIIWNSFDIRGKQISSGVYLYKLQIDSDIYTDKAVLLK